MLRAARIVAAMQAVGPAEATLHRWWWRFTWITWVFGPGSLLAIAALQRWSPSSLEPPTLPILVLPCSHWFGFFLMVGVWLVPGPHRRSAVFWCLTGYWLLVVGALLLVWRQELAAVDSLLAGALALAAAALPLTLLELLWRLARRPGRLAG